MNHRLSKDEFDALAEVNKTPKSIKPSACVARNAKRLLGIKFLIHRKDGSFQLTEKGVEALFVKDCISALRALASVADTKIDARVATFLARKGHIVAGTVPGDLEITPKGRECLEDISLNT